MLDQTQPPSTTTIIITMTTNNGYKDKPVAWLSIGQDKWMYVALIRSVYTTEFNFSSFVIPIRERFRTHSTKSMKCSALVFFLSWWVFLSNYNDPMVFRLLKKKTVGYRSILCGSLVNRESDQLLHKKNCFSFLINAC